MNTEEPPPLPPELPPGASRLELPADIMDHLMAYWELKDHGEIFSWSARLLYDLSKLDEAGWRLTLQKCEIDEQPRQVRYSRDHAPIHVLMKWLAPTVAGFNRLPTAETLNELMLIKKD